MSFWRRLQLCLAAFCGVLSLAVVDPAYAETGEVRAAQQFGLSYLALMIMADSKLIEKQAKAMGLGDSLQAHVGHQGDGRGVAEDDGGPAGRIHAGAEEHDEDRGVHGEGRHDQGKAFVVEGLVLSERAPTSGQLTWTLASPARTR
jgi:hypothetical protein